VRSWITKKNSVKVLDLYESENPKLARSRIKEIISIHVYENLNCEKLFVSFEFQTSHIQNAP